LAAVSGALQWVVLVTALELLGVLTFRKYVADLTPNSRRKVMAWAILIVAGLAEIVWLVALKNSNGFANAPQGMLSIAVSWVSFFMLAYALKFIPAGTAYAVWTGCGAAGGAIAGMLLFGEGRDALRVASITLIVIGIVGIRLGDLHAATAG
jgi:quaternary ammonium compound-resistance protein SugE